MRGRAQRRSSARYRHRAGEGGEDRAAHEGAVQGAATTAARTPVRERSGEAVDARAARRSGPRADFETPIRLRPMAKKTSASAATTSGDWSWKPPTASPAAQGDSAPPRARTTPAVQSEAARSWRRRGRCRPSSPAPAPHREHREDAGHQVEMRPPRKAKPRTVRARAPSRGRGGRGQGRRGGSVRRRGLAVPTGEDRDGGDNGDLGGLRGSRMAACPAAMTGGRRGCRLSGGGVLMQPAAAGEDRGGEVRLASSGAPRAMASAPFLGSAEGGGPGLGAGEAARAATESAAMAASAGAGAARTGRSSVRLATSGMQISSQTSQTTWGFSGIDDPGAAASAP